WLVWISVGLRGERRPELLPPPLPTLLDSGNNFDFYLHNHQLVHWAGMNPILLPSRGDKSVNRQKVPCHEADVWIYPNEPGTHRQRKGTSPFLLELNEGIAIAPELPGRPIDPRLPLLGFSVLRKSRLDF